MKKKTLGILLVGLFMVFLVLLFCLISSIDIPEPKCRTQYVLENGVICNYYAANDFASSHAKKCSDGGTYMNPTNVKIKTVCENDVSVGEGVA